PRRSPDLDADPRVQLDILESLREREPDNLVAAFDRARLLARLEDGPRLEQALQEFDARVDGWSPAATSQLATIRSALAAGNFRSIGSGLAFLQNLVTPTPAYQAALASLGQTGGSIGQPLREFLAYSEPQVVVAPVDEALAFTLEPDPRFSAAPSFHAAWILDADSGPTLLSLAAEGLHIGDATVLPAPRGADAIRRNSLCAADFNGDARQDLALNTGDGLTMWTQSADGAFAVYRPEQDTRAVVSQPGRGVWVIDYDVEGDLDLLVGRRGDAP